MTEQDYIQILRAEHKKLLLSKEVTAIELNMSQSTLDRLRKTGQIQSKKVSGQIMFTLGEIASYMAA
jgi:hypothetical protein